jgi:hypothetical protein
MEDTKLMEKMIVDHMHDLTTRRLPSCDACDVGCCDEGESFRRIDEEPELFMNELDEESED